MRPRYVVLLVGLILAVSVPALAGKPGDRPTVSVPSQYPCNQQGSPGLCLPLDSTWQVVPFTNAQADCYENDDGSSDMVTLPFTFDLFGTPQTQLWINNNGNVSFGGPYSTYTPEGFPVADYPMVAAFWGDVDTRALDNGAGVVWMKMDPHYLAVTWDHVGYYSQHTDLQSTFQLIISDGTFDGIGAGNNVCFCYGDMQWTTGDASGGSGGFGGSAATTGVNKGDGVNYFNVGRFDHSGADYAGPDGISGVDWLDDQEICFNVSGDVNQCPVAINFPANNTVVLDETHPSLNLTVGFIGPEAGQTVHTEVDTGGLANFDFVSTDGNPSTVGMTFTPDINEVGDHVIHFAATDDYDPPCTTEVALTISVQPNVATESRTFGDLKSMYR